MQNIEIKSRKKPKISKDGQVRVKSNITNQKRQNIEESHTQKKTSRKKPNKQNFDINAKLREKTKREKRETSREM